MHDLRVVLVCALFLSPASSLGCLPHKHESSGTKGEQAGMSDLEQRVGQRIVLEGVVSNTKVPQVQGVEVRALEDHRGQQVRVSGVLHKTVVTASDLEPLVANRGMGTFYFLDDIKFELLK